MPTVRITKTIATVSGFSDDDDDDESAPTVGERVGDSVGAREG